VNNVEYVQWMQDVAIQHASACGGTAAAEADGATWVARSHKIEYLSPAFAGDQIEATTWVENMLRVKSLRCYEFFRSSDARMIARGETDWVYVDATTGRPRRIPESVSRCFCPANARSVELPTRNT
jgi:acyl-CoA thioester hydrolase